MEASRSYLTFFQRNHDLKGPFAAQRVVLRYAPSNQITKRPARC